MTGREVTREQALEALAWCEESDGYDGHHAPVWIDELAETVVALHDRLAMVRTDDRVEVVCFYCDPPRVFALQVGAPIPVDPALHDGHSPHVGPYLAPVRMTPSQERDALREEAGRIIAAWEHDNAEFGWETQGPETLRWARTVAALYDQRDAAVEAMARLMGDVMRQDIERTAERMNDHAEASAKLMDRFVAGMVTDEVEALRSCLARLRNGWVPMYRWQTKDHGWAKEHPEGRGWPGVAAWEPMTPAEQEVMADG